MSLFIICGYLYGQEAVSKMVETEHLVDAITIFESHLVKGNEDIDCHIASAMCLVDVFSQRLGNKANHYIDCLHDKAMIESSSFILDKPLPNDFSSQPAELMDKYVTDNSNIVFDGWEANELWDQMDNRSISLKKFAAIPLNSVLK